MRYEDLPQDDAGELLILEVEFPVHYTLIKPLMTDGTAQEVLTIREPTVLDLEALDKKAHLGNIERSCLMIAAICGIAPDDAQQMGWRDFKRVQDFVINFM